MRTVTLLFGAVALLVLPLTATARKKVGVDELLASAAELRKKGDAPGAARLYGRAARVAQRASDPTGEERVARGLADLLDGLVQRGWPEDSAARFEETAAAALSELDPARAAAWVSAASLAREMLLVATESGERRSAPAASEVLTKFAHGRHRGKAAGALADYAAGLAGLDADPEKAVARLESALAVAADARWYETATALATELAVAHLAANRPEEARKALARAAKAHEGYPDTQVLIGWSDVVRKRIADAPEEVLAPYRSALDALRRAVPEAGEPGGGADTVPLVLPDLWKRLRSSTTIVAVTRRPEGCAVRLGYGDKQEASFRFRTGHRFLSVDAVVLGFHGHAVSLERLCLEGSTSHRGGSPVRARFRAWTLLAEGETWTLRRDGTVVVR